MKKENLQKITAGSVLRHPVAKESPYQHITSQD
jgi:hypothetical protein